MALLKSWRAYTASLGVPRSKTRQPEGMFQPFLRWANGGDRDTTSRLAKLAALLDEWVELGDDRPSPITNVFGTSEFARWYSRSSGYTNVAERRRGRGDENYSKSDFANSEPVVRGTETQAIRTSTEQPYSSWLSTGTGKAQPRGVSSAQQTTMPSCGAVFGPQSALVHLIGKVIHGDCLEIMSLIPDKSGIKGIITSPPYNIRNSTGGGLRNANGGKWPDAELSKGYDGHDDMMDDQEYNTWQRKFLCEAIRIVPDDGVIFYNHKWRVQDLALQGRAEIVDGHSLPVRQIIIWARQGGINCNPQYFLPTYEVIYVIAGKEFKLSAAGRKYHDVWQIPPERDNPHPAPFPLELPRRCIESIDDGIILDPFMGSGTTAIAAMELGRQWIGIEKSYKYCISAMERINAVAGSAVTRVLSLLDVRQLVS